MATPRRTQPQHYVIINGRRVSADNGKSLDGPRHIGQRLAHDLDLRPQHKHNAPVVTHSSRAQTVDGFKRITSPQAASTRKNHMKQTPAKHIHTRTTHTSPRPTTANRRDSSSAPTTPQHARQTQKVTTKPSLFSQRKSQRASVQTAKLTEARAQRASIHRQHGQVTRFGSMHGYPPEPQARQEVHKPTRFHVEPLVTNLGQLISAHNVDLRHIDPRQPKEADISPQRKLHLRNLLTARRTVSYAAVAMTLVMIVGYTAYLNAPNLSIRVAASRSGVQAQLPDYQPSGFVRSGSIQYEAGQVVVSFQSNADSRRFDLTQRSSNWDSSSLLANYVEPQSSQYDTITEGGLTIYIYDGSNASWVNKGIWYIIEGESLLSSQQIASMATSF